MSLLMCAPPNRGGKKLFAIDSLLHAQALFLSRVDAQLDKSIVLGKEQEELTITPLDTTAWLKELEVFSVMDVINKPINRDRYQTSESADIKSNLRIKSFRTTDDLPISYMNVYYHNLPAKIRKIEALYRELNGLYKTSRLLTLEFSDVEGTPIMNTYSILGGQKMFMDDTVQYDIKGRVKF